MTVQLEPPAIDPTWLDQAETFSDGFDAGWTAAKRDSASTAERDELLARRIVALLLQHDYNGQLVASVVRLWPYPGRTDNGLNWAEFLQRGTP